MENVSALLESRNPLELASLLLNATFDSAILIDQDSRVVLTNDIAARRFGLTPEAMRGRCYFDLLPPDLAVARRIKFLEAIGEKRRVVSRDERAGIDFEISYTPILDEAGEVAALALFGRDVTELKRVEQVRETVERMAKHDMKSALIGIVGLAGALLRRGDLEDKDQAFLETIRENGENLLNMIYASLDLFKMEQGTYTPCHDAFDVAMAIERVLMNLRDLAESRHVAFETLVDGEPLGERTCAFFGEERYVETCLANLVKNAVEASPEGGTVRVEAICRPCSRVTVHNQGAIPEAIRDSFLDPFVTSGKPGGSGLGVYSARLIAKAHGGELRFASDEEEGTTAVLELPGREEKTSGS